MSEEVKKEKVKKVFLDNLPKWTSGTYKGKIKWKDSLNYDVEFNYEGLIGLFKIVDYQYPFIWVKYKENNPYKTHISTFIKGSIKGIIINDVYNFDKTSNNAIWIDLKSLPLNGEGIDWINTLGISISFRYENIEGKIKIIGYNNKVLTIKYLDKNPFNITINNFIYCKLGNYLGLKTTEFRLNIGETLKDNKRDLTIVDMKFINKKGKCYRYKCNKCGFDGGKYYDTKNNKYEEEYWIREADLIKGKGCSCCCNPSQIVVEGINDIITTDNWMVKFFPNGYNQAKIYNRCSTKKINPLCPDCETIRTKPISIYNIYISKSMCCSRCGDGVKYPEKFITNVLEQLNLTFKKEYKPNWCEYKDCKNKIKTGRYDFLLEGIYINDKQIIIETDGGFHTNYNNMSGQTKEESKYIDDEKDRLALENGYEVIRINCEESNMDFIRTSIYNSKLNGLVNLSYINWTECEKVATTSNIQKQACEIKRDNPNMGSSEIGKMLNRSSGTVTNYIKQGSKIWDWCVYDPKEELRKNGSRNGKSTSKPIEIFKDGVSLGIYPSCAELEREGERLFGVKLLHGSISSVCNGKRNSHKGFTFKYVQST
jgi:hypothetical protein